MPPSIECECQQCGKKFLRELRYINRSLKNGMKLFCSRVCSGVAKRLVNPPTEDARKLAKSQYDKEYRERNRETRKKQKSEYFRKTYDPEKAREHRKENMARHVEYCRRPDYRAKKREYDIARHGKEYGEFAESWRLLLELEKELVKQASSYERRVQKGYYTKDALRRRRELCQMKIKLNLPQAI